MLNVHLHSLVPDGVWVETAPSGAPPALAFRRLGAPSDEERHGIGWRSCQRVLDVLRRDGRWLDDGPDGEDDFEQQEPLLAEVYGASIRGRLALGPGRGERVMVFRHAPDLRIPQDLQSSAHEPAGPRAYAFDVHAAVHVEAHNRKGLERLCRYLCRPAAANDRFEETDDGRIAVRLKRAWRNGTSHVVLSPLQLVEKLVALVPPPRVHMIRYHGCFAPHAKHRAKIVPQQPPSLDDAARGEDPVPRCTHAGRQRWAMLMRRTFAVDVERCPKCGAKDTQVKLVTAKEEIEKLLCAAGHPADSPLTGRAA